MSDINSNWEKVSLADLFIVEGGGTPDKREPSYWNGDIPWASVKDVKTKILNSTIDSITKEGLDNSATNLAKKGDVILITRISPGETSIAGIDSAVNQDLKIIKYFAGISPEFIYYLFKVNKQEFLKRASGTTVKGIKLTDLNHIIIDLPPLQEQHRVVAKIEELFSELDNGIQNLKVAQDQLNVYQQALLKHAFEGKLTEEWRRENNPEPAEKLLERIKEERQVRYEQELKNWKAAMNKWEKKGKKEKKPGKPKLVAAINNVSDHIVKAWVNCNIEQVCYKVTDGSHNPPQKQNEGLPMLSARNIENSSIVFDDYRTIGEDSFELEYKRANVEPGDVLLTVVGTIGRSTVVPFNLPRFTLQRSVALLKTEIESKYLSLAFQGPDFQQELLKEAKGTAQKGVYLNTLRKLTIPLCSIEEQIKIIEILEYRFSIIDNMESTIEKELKKSELGRQSILKRAFEGKLVDQDPDDEPASELIKRIQEEKKKYVEEQNQQKKKAPKKAKKMSKELSIEEVLKASRKPLLAKDVWQKSKHSGDIEEFYSELKKLGSKVKEIREEMESKLTLSK